MSLSRLVVIVVVLAAVAGGLYYAGIIPGRDKPAANAAPAESDAYAEGGRLFLLSRFGESITAYRDALGRKPTDPRAPEARYRIAKSFEELKKPSEALRAYEDLVAAHPNDSHVANARKRIEFLRETGVR